MIATIDRKLETGASISAVADSLDLSVRTLQRRLFAQGLSYRRLLDERRRRRAQTELRRHEKTVSEISRSLGYSDPAHFVRAFRRWVGCSPSRFEQADESLTGSTCKR